MDANINSNTALFFLSVKNGNADEKLAWWIYKFNQQFHLINGCFYSIPRISERFKHIVRMK